MIPRRPLNHSMQLLGLLHRTRSCIVSNFWLAGMPSRHYLAATGCPSLAPVLVLLGGQNSIRAGILQRGGGGGVDSSTKFYKTLLIVQGCTIISTCLQRSTLRFTHACYELYQTSQIYLTGISSLNSNLCLLGLIAPNVSNRNTAWGRASVSPALLLHRIP